MQPYLKALVLFLVALAGTHVHAQAVKKPALHRQYDEKLTDRQKLDILERKAELELTRKEKSEARGLKYDPLRNSLQIFLPSTSSLGHARLEQLNRIAPQASESARFWIDYEYEVLADYTKKLISRGK